MARLLIEVSGKNAEEAIKSLRAETEKLGGSVKQLGPEMDKVGSAGRKLDQDLAAPKKSLADFNRVALTAAVGFAALSAALIAGLGAAAIKALRSSGQIDDSLTNLKESAHSLAEAFASGLSPAVNQIINALANLVRNEDVQGYFRVLGEIVGKLIGILVSLARVVRDTVAGAFQIVAEASQGLAKALDKIGGLGPLQGQAVGLASTFADLRSSILSINTAATGKDDGTGDGGLVGAMKRLKEVQESIKKAERAMKQFAEESSAAADAVREQWRMEDQIKELEAAFEEISFAQVVENANIAANDIAEAFKGAFADSDEWIFGEFLKSGAGGPPPELEAAWTDMWKKLSRIAGNILYDALTGGEINWEDIGIQAGSAIGSTIGAKLGSKMGPLGEIFGEALGEAAGAAIGKAIGGLFGGDSNKSQGSFSVGQNFFAKGGVDDFQAQFQQALDALESILDHVNEIVGGSLFLTEQMEVIVNKQGDAILKIKDGITGQELSSQSFASQQEAMDAGLAQLLSTAVINASGPVGAAFQEVLGNAAMVGLEGTIASLEKLSEVADFLQGLDPAFDSTLSQIAMFRAEIENMGLSAETTADLLLDLADAEAARMAELETDVLQRLVNVLAQIPGMEEERARIQAQINQAKFQIEVAMIEVQLNALGLMTAAFEQMLAVAKRFGEELGNFNVSVPDIRVPRVRIPRGGGGGGRSGPSEEERAAEQAARDRERLLETLQDLATTPHFNSLNDRLAELKDQFFGPDGFMAEARRLGVDLETVMQAFRHQRQLLMDEANRGIRDFLGSLGASAFNPGGIGAQLGSSLSSFQDLVARAGAGDLDARAQAAESAQTVLELARQRYGNTNRYRQIYQQVTGSLEGLLGSTASLDAQSVELQRRQVELLEIIAGVSNVTPFNAYEREMVDEMRRLRADNAESRATLSRQDKELHAAAQAERVRLRAEVEKANNQPRLYKKNGTNLL